MNLHGIVSGAIGMVNPFKQIEIQRQVGGYTTASDGTRTPNYYTLNGPAQIQDLSSDDLKLLQDAGFNIQGSRKNVYLDGQWAGVVRADQVGGDVFRFDGKDWLVTLIAEQWPDWTKVIVTLQSPNVISPFASPAAPPLPLPHRSS